MTFRLLNIPVHIQPAFWIFLLFFTNIYRDPSIESVILGCVFTFSLLVHEFGHALTAVHFGARPTITLEAFGGNAQYNGYGISPKQRFFITLNGPLFESLLIFIPYFLLQSGIFAHHHYIQYTLYVTMRLNILWCLLNLIPLAPLDGGQMARYLLERKWGPKGHKASIILGLVSAAVITPYLFYLGYFFFGMLLVIFALQHVQTLLQTKKSSGENNHSSQYLRGVEAIQSNDLENAKAILKKLLKCKDKKIKHSATESLAEVYYQQNQSQKSYDLLLKTDHQALSKGKCLLCKLAYERKNYELVSKYSLEIYNIDPSYEIAVLNSKTYASLNQPRLAGGWLETASKFEGISRENIQGLLHHQTYDVVRDQDAFRQYAEKL